jgi:lambda repressor-like predicted transcriptional regulator
MMHPSEIKAALERAGVTQVGLAKRLRVKQPTVSCVIRGKATSRRIAQAISRATGKPLSVLWPGKYD